MLGIWLSPKLLGDAAPSLWVSLGALFIVLLCASFGQALFQFAGGRLRDKIPWQPVRALDAVGGGVLSVAAVLIVAWALGVALSGASLPAVSKQVNDSAILSRVNTVMPARAVDVAVVQRRGGYQLLPAIPGAVRPGADRRGRASPPRIAKNANVIRAGKSVLKVRGENVCGRGVEGSGFLFQPDRLMTNAHVVAGVRDPQVIVDGDEVDAKVVYYDPKRDIAVLSVPGLDLPYLRFDLDGEAGAAGAVLGFPEDGPYDVQAARIRSVQRLRSLTSTVRGR